MEREHRSVLTLLARAPFTTGATVRLDDDAAQHARARRVRAGEPVRLLDGAGAIGTGVIEALARDGIDVRVDDITRVDPPPALDILIPVADRDRMLLAAEKCVELQITAWRPVYFARSRSVGTRGEGLKFRDKVAARMRSALEQSGGAWLPAVHEESDADAAFRDVAIEARYILDAGGQPFHGRDFQRDIAIALGPEGGFESGELERAASCGWLPASLGATTLRFETAVIAAAAIVRAAQHSHGRP
ncbi:MAG TPA: RsmE family RNA methyltransferase [Gemmatimonadaceae bacterium]